MGQAELLQLSLCFWGERPSIDAASLSDRLLLFTPNKAGEQKIQRRTEQVLQRSR